jgi:hypothetical protein
VEEPTTYVPSDEEIRHLEMIQGVINRLAGNSAKAKDFAIAVTGAAVAVLTATESRPGYAVAVLPVLFVLAYLDAYYLRLERLFRVLHEGVRRGWSASDVEPFSMNVAAYESKVPPTLAICLTRSVWPVYATLALAPAIVSLLRF